MEELLNIYVCIIAPLLLMFFLLKNENKMLNLFLIIGMSVCLTAGYVNDYMIGLTGYTHIQSTYYITPICEEVLKALPILLYVYVFKPKSEMIISSALSVGIGFATLENVYYITVYGAEDFIFLLMRGFATGIMHGLCTAMIGFGSAFIYRKKGLALTGTFGLLCGSITYHATYNLLISSPGLAEMIGIFLPITTAAVCFILLHHPLIKKFKVRFYTKLSLIHKKI